MKEARYLSFLMAVLSLLWISAGCQPDVSKPPSTAEPVSEMNVSIIGKSYALLLDSDGKLLNNTELATIDRALILTIDKGTRLLDETEKPLSSLQVGIELEPPLPPARARRVSAVFTIEPRGALFKPPLTLSLDYDPAWLPEEASENDLYIMSFNEPSNWGRLDFNRVDAGRRLVTTRISQPGKYAVLSPSETEKYTLFVPPSNPDMLEIVYFHSPLRCTVCTNAEYATRFTLENYLENKGYG
jgi:hypothetical protein